MLTPAGSLDAFEAVNEALSVTAIGPWKVDPL